MDTYLIENRDVLCQKMRERYQANQEYHRAYRAEHRERDMETNRVWHERNADYVRQKAKEQREAAIPVACPCGGRFRPRRSWEHQRTGLHRAYMARLAAEPAEAAAPEEPPEEVAAPEADAPPA